jgi:hypothetical protein
MDRVAAPVGFMSQNRLERVPIDGIRLQSNSLESQRTKAAFFSIPFPNPIGAIMADNPDTRPGEVAVVTPVSDTPHAPFIFYEGASTFGHTNGVINLTLSASRTCVGPDGAVKNDLVVVAYLRGNLQAALSLREAIDKALLLSAPTKQGMN